MFLDVDRHCKRHHPIRCEMATGDSGVGQLGVCGGKNRRKKGSKGGEDEKTWGASFDAVNVQIYVEGQWSTFIRSFCLPSLSLRPRLFPPLLFLSQSVSPHRLSPFFLSPSCSPSFCHSLSYLPFLPCLPCLLSISPDSPFLLSSMSYERTEIVVDCSNHTNRRHR